MKDRKVQPEEIKQRDGRVRYDISQLMNPTSITFSPGGLWKQDVLLYGSVGTVSDDAEAQLLMKHFAREIKKSFRRIKAYWVGPQAETLLRAGKRLTLAEQSPQTFDLRDDVGTT